MTVIKIRSSIVTFSLSNKRENSIISGSNGDEYETVAFLDVPCRPVDTYRRFRGAYYFHQFSRATMIMKEAVARTKMLPLLNVI
jgi:hypothetical protein